MFRACEVETLRTRPCVCSRLPYPFLGSQPLLGPGRLGIVCPWSLSSSEVALTSRKPLRLGEGPVIPLPTVGWGTPGGQLPPGVCRFPPAALLQSFGPSVRSTDIVLRALQTLRAGGRRTAQAGTWAPRRAARPAVVLAGHWSSGKRPPVVPAPPAWASSPGAHRAGPRPACQGRLAASRLHRAASASPTREHSTFA